LLFENYGQEVGGYQYIVGPQPKSWGFGDQFPPVPTVVAPMRTTGSLPRCCSLQADLRVSGVERVRHCSGHQRVDVFLRSNKRCGFCSPSLPDFGEQLAECDHRLL